MNFCALFLEKTHGGRWLVGNWELQSDVLVGEFNDLFRIDNNKTESKLSVLDLENYNPYIAS